MTRTLIARRLARIEDRAATSAPAPRIHTLVFVNTDGTVASTIELVVGAVPKSTLTRSAMALKQRHQSAYR